MKHFLTTLLCTFLYIVLYAQTDLSGVYNDDGYSFNAPYSSSLSFIKLVTLVSPNVYEMNFGAQGNIGNKGFKFQFSLDLNNNIINWVAIGNTPSDPSSGLMTADNPGNSCPAYTAYSGFPYGYVSSRYNNRYNPLTRTFYLHYGFGIGSTGQNGYTTQVYEKLTFGYPPKIFSVSPLTGTSFTKVTIKGENLSHVSASIHSDNSITIGNNVPDSISSKSDSELVVWIGAGATGSIKLKNIYGSDSINGFVYNPIPIITKPLWENIGNLNLQTAHSHYAAVAVNRHNIPYVTYTDSLSIVRLVKYNNGSWQSVGDSISDGKAGNPKIVFDSSDIPYVAYIDSLYGNVVNLKVFNNGKWSYAGWMGANAYQGKYSIVMDNNFPYVAYLEYNPNYMDYNAISYNKYVLSVLKYDGSNWDFVGGQGFIGTDDPFEDLAIDHKTHTPYVVFSGADSVSNINALIFPSHVMKFNGTDWVYVGNNFVVYGGTETFINPTTFNTTIAVDSSGNPMVSFVMYDYPMRQQTFKYNNGIWNQLGNKSFSNSYSLALCHEVQ